MLAPMAVVIPTDETLISETPERVPLHFALVLKKRVIWPA